MVFFLEENQFSFLRSYHSIRMRNEAKIRRVMSTIVELSPEQAQPSTENCDFDQEEKRTSLSPLAQGKFI